MTEFEQAERLDQLNLAASRALDEFEQRVQILASQVESLRKQLDADRQQMAAAEQSFADGAAGAVDGTLDGRIDRDAVARSHQALVTQLRQVSSVQQRVSGLASLLTIGRAQLAPAGDATGETDAMNVVARAASIRAQEAERYRLAREIHDGPAQVLANAILGLELCEQIARRTPAKVVDEIVRLKATVREGLVEVRRFIFDLRPSSLVERGLLVTLQRYVAEYTNYSGVPVELLLPTELAQPAKDEEITLFRVVQESLQNVQKHARASHVVVRIAEDNGGLLLTVHDDGRGFSPGEVDVTTRAGAGLGGMKERAKLVGGELAIDSAPGAGTTVALRLPRARRDQLPATEPAEKGSPRG